jgi:hypothetical protein
MVSFKSSGSEHLSEKNLECRKSNIDIIDLGALKQNIQWGTILNQGILNEGSIVNSSMCNWVKE